MRADRWRRIEELYHAALDLPAPSRRPWLATACGGEDALREEVEALIGYDGAGGRLLERSALEVEAKALARERRGGLIGRRLGGYEVLALLGAGGMGEVYRARDLRLRREVALKVFEGASGLESIGRIEADARAASVLNHPGVVTIYGVGEEGDAAWIAMELAEGRRLRDLLSGEPLPPSQALDIAVQLGEAVAAAHTSGIAHRDLKPENVMISPAGRVKVLDFGIAAREPEGPVAEGRAGGLAPEDGALVGTVDYMSPEQARGHAAGPASDQFSFGVICHEMLTGRRPLAGATRRDTLRSLASADPIPPPAVGPAIAGFGAVVSRCLAKEPGRRYRDGAELLAALRRVEQEYAHPAAPARRRVIALGGLAAFGVVSGAAAWRWWPRDPAPRSLAVLPFSNPTGDETTEYLCDGVAETLIRQIAGLGGPTVIARATAFSFKGRSADPRAIGQRLGVEAVLTGSLTRRAGRLRVSAELVDSRTGARLWGGELDRPAADVLAVQDEIARAILEEGLHLAPTARQRRRLAQRLTDDPAAYELFLEGVHHLRLATEADYLAARDLLARAVERDPRFALALVTLASTHSVMAIDGYAAPGDTWPESERIVARALAIDPESPDGRAEAASSAFFYRWDWAEAERQWTSAFRLRSEVQSELLAACALQKWATGEAQAALELARAARQVDPLNTEAVVREADLLAAVGRLDEAAERYERTVREQPEDPRARFGLAEVRRRQGRFDEALAARRRAHLAAGDDSLERDFARARGAAGYREIVRASARHELERLSARAEAGGYVSPLDFGRAFALLGDATQAFARLAAALDERASGLPLLKVDPAWDGLRGDARFAAAVARVGIPQPAGSGEVVRG